MKVPTKLKDTKRVLKESTDYVIRRIAELNIRYTKVVVVNATDFCTANNALGVAFTTPEPDGTYYIGVNLNATQPLEDILEHELLHILLASRGRDYTDGSLSYVSAATRTNTQWYFTDSQGFDTSIVSQVFGVNVAAMCAHSLYSSDFCRETYNVLRNINSSLSKEFKYWWFKLNDTVGYEVIPSGGR